MTDEYTKIAWSDVQPGDILMHENGDRLTARRVDSVWVSVPGSQHNIHYWEQLGFSPYRKVEPLPTQPGAYLDKDGDYWLRDRDGNWYDWSSLREPNPRGGIPDAYAPFTRLVPMPTREALGEAIGGEVATAAVMALFEQEVGS